MSVKKDALSLSDSTGCSQRVMQNASDPIFIQLVLNVVSFCVPFQQQVKLHTDYLSLLGASAICIRAGCEGELTSHTSQPLSF